MRKYLASTLMVVSVLVVCSLWSNPAVANERERVIRVASPGTYQPFTMYEELTQTLSGFEIDLWNAIGERIGYKIDFVRIDMPACFAEMDLGHVDTVAKQVSITPARRQKYDFTQPYFFSPYSLTVAEANNEVKTWKDLEGKSIALREGDAMIEFIAARDPENKVHRAIYETSASMLQDVSMGRVAAVPYPFLTLPYHLKRNPALKLKSVDLDNPLYTEVNAYPFARTERGRKLLELTDGILTRMIEDGSYAKLCEKWFGMNVMDSRYAKEYREKQGDKQGK